MALFSSNEFNRLDDLLVNQLEDLYDAEVRITNALPKMADAARSTELKAAFHEHLGQTQHQVRRLEEIFTLLGRSPERETCEAMKGLIAEGEEMIDARGDDRVRDAALIAAAQRVEHYEIAGYGTARTIAQTLGRSDAAKLLQQTLDEEKMTDEKLTRLAEQSINALAATKV
jgi:ferritin-like metal-binding protein YciE